MSWEAYNQVINAPHKAHLSHELIAAAASYEAMKAWENHKANLGESVSHSGMKEFLAAATGAFVIRLIETKGLDAIDRHRVQRDAEGHYAHHIERHHHHHYHRY